MAYIPPHKRRPKGDGSERPPPPRPELLSPVFMKNPKPRSQSQRVLRIAYRSNLIKRWFAVGLDDRNQLPASVRLEPVAVVDNVPRFGEKFLAFINTELDGECSSDVSKTPWIQIAENVTRDLISSFEHAAREVEIHGAEAVKPILVARFGKVIFRSSSHESVTESSYCEDTVKSFPRFLHTNIPKTYMDYIAEEGARKIGLELKREKVMYIVGLLDSSRPKSALSCKCSVVDGKLQLCKVEFLTRRYAVVDISCLEKNVDLRLMLSTKIFAVNLTDDDLRSIHDIIDSAIIDHSVKGGLRWPFGKAASGEKFSIQGMWHSEVRVYINSSMKLKVRDSDIFHFETSDEKKVREVFVELRKVASNLKEPGIDENPIKEMLKDDLRVLWESFFCCESFLKW